MKNYKIEYLPLFYKDLEKTTNYIKYKLKNKIAADNLLEEVENGIKERSLNPESFEEFHSSRKRKNKYYKIYIKNYIVFYIVKDDIMEVRRILFNKSNYKNKV